MSNIKDKLDEFLIENNASLRVDVSVSGSENKTRLSISVVQKHKFIVVDIYETTDIFSKGRDCGCCSFYDPVSTKPNLKLVKLTNTVKSLTADIEKIKQICSNMG